MRWYRPSTTFKAARSDVPTIGYVRGRSDISTTQEPKKAAPRNVTMTFPTNHIGPRPISNNDLMSGFTSPANPR